VPWESRLKAKQAFVVLHRQRYGYDHDTELELVNLRVTVTARGAEIVLPRVAVNAPSNAAENTANGGNKSASSQVNSTDLAFTQAFIATRSVIANTRARW
jgi:hypothetical protein